MDSLLTAMTTTNALIVGIRKSLQRFIVLIVEKRWSMKSLFIGNDIVERNGWKEVF